MQHTNTLIVILIVCFAGFIKNDNCNRKTIHSTRLHSIYLGLGDNIRGQFDNSKVALADGLLQFVISNAKQTLLATSAAAASNDILSSIVAIFTANPLRFR